MTSQSPEYIVVTSGGRPTQERHSCWRSLRDDPTIQRELQAVAGRVQGVLAGRCVLEPVCGDGWWTSHLAQSAQYVTALETDGDALRRAAARRLPSGRVRLMEAPPEALAQVPGFFDAAFAAFLCGGTEYSSPIDLLTIMHDRLGPGGTVVLVDVHTADPATGAMTESAMRALVREIAPDARDLRLDVGQRLWCFSYTL